MRRQLIAGAAVAALVAASGLAGASPAPAPSSATVTLQLPSASVDGVADAALGRLTASATGGSSPLGSIGVSSPLGGFAVDSAHGPQRDDRTLRLGAAGVQATLDLLSYAVDAGADHATAALAGGRLSLGTDVVHTGLAVDGTGLAATVDRDGATSTLSVRTGGLSLTLGDLLPAALRDRLPLSVLLHLVDALGLKVPAATTLRTLVGQVGSAADVLGQLQDAQDALGTAVGDAGHGDLLGAVSDAQAAVDAAAAQVSADEQAVSDAQSTLAAAQQQLDALLNPAPLPSLSTTLPVPLPSPSASLPVPLPSPSLSVSPLPLPSVSLSLSPTPLPSVTLLGLARPRVDLAGAEQAVAAAQTALVSAQSTLGSDQAALAAAQQTLQQANQALLDVSGDPALQAAQQVVLDLRSRLSGLLSTLQDTLTGAPSLRTLRLDLLDAVADAPLLSVAGATVAVTAAADGGHATSAVTCTPGAVTVLGVAVPVPDCAAVRALASRLTAALDGALQALPAASALPKVGVDGLEQQRAATPQPGSDGATSASAGITPLELSVGALRLADVADQLTAALRSQLGALVGGASAAAVPLLRPHATVPAGLQDQLAALQAQLATLPSGTGLAGLKTTGLDVSLGGVSGTARFLPAAGSTLTSTGGTAGNPAAGSPGGSGSTGSGAPAAGSSTSVSAPAPGAAAPGGGLPFTGADLPPMVAVALLLAVAGAHAVLLGRPRVRRARGG